MHAKLLPYMHTQHNYDGLIWRPKECKLYQRNPPLYFFYRFPEPKAHTFILEFILLESTYYAEANKRVAFILDIMKLDVPDLFCDQRGDTSPPGETFKMYLHGYIASSCLSRDLLKCVDTIMVSCFNYKELQPITILLVGQLVKEHSLSEILLPP